VPALPTVLSPQSQITALVSPGSVASLLPVITPSAAPSGLASPAADVQSSPDRKNGGPDSGSFTLVMPAATAEVLGGVILALVITLAAAGVAVGATVASAAATSSSPATQPAGNYVFACVNKSGKIDYLEFRKPLPHQCWFSGETLWYWDAVPVATPTATATPSATPTPTPTSSATTTANPASTASATPSPS
jgi:hypothetical protein